nr:glycosyltransferase family 25 protein [Roseospira goensis]
MPVFVLNLPRDTDRRARVEADLARVGLQGVFVPGVDGQALTAADWARYDGPRCRVRYGTDMLPGELGCYLGHERVLRRMLEGCHRVALVLEDDARLSEDLRPLLEVLLSGPPSWQVVRLSSMRPRQVAEAVAGRRPDLPLTEGRGLFRLKTHVLGAQGYVVTAEGARGLLACGRRIVLPWDHMMDRFWENGIVPYVVWPPPVRHGTELPSCIGARDPRRRYESGVVTLWRRRMNRWRDGLGKRWYTLRHP